MKKLKNNKGLTLIELVIALFVFAVISGTVAAAVGPILRIYTRANDIAEANKMMDTLSRDLLNDLTYAKKIATPSSLVPNFAEIKRGNPAVTITYDVDVNGYLCRNGAPVYSAEYYKRKSVEFNVTGPTDGVYTVTLTLTGDGGAWSRERVYSVKPLVLS